MEKIGIVILNYKSYHLTIDAIGSLAKSELDDDSTLEFYIVDNHSENSSLEKIDAFIKDNRYDDHFVFDLIQSPINGGYAKGINLGIKKAVMNGCDYIATVNPDIIVKKNSLSNLYNKLKSSEYALLGPKIYDFDGKLDRACARHEPQIMTYFFCAGILEKIFPDNRYLADYYIKVDDIDDSVIDVDAISGAFMLFKKDALITIDYFDENTFLYNEELIIHEKLKKKNLKSGIYTNSVVNHLRGGSTNNVKTAKFLFDSLLESSKYYLSYYRNFSFMTITLIVTYRRLSYLLLYWYKFFLKL